jgi:hypothetical protein
LLLGSLADHTVQLQTVECWARAPLDLTAVCSSVAMFLFCMHRLRTLPARRMIVTLF